MAAKQPEGVPHILHPVQQLRFCTTLLKEEGFFFLHTIHPVYMQHPLCARMERFLRSPAFAVFDSGEVVILGTVVTYGK